MEVNKRYFDSIYRGFVVWNDDPAVRGRLKIFVPGVYSDLYSDKPELLPWACPAMPPFCGNSVNPKASAEKLLNNETGWSSPPHAGDAAVGAQVWVFFEHGDINFPIYFAFAQSGEGWLSEHPNQHVFKSDNVRIRIDENVLDDRSTCKFDSYNSKNSKVAKTNLDKDCKRHGWKFDRNSGNIKDLETRIDIEILAENLNAVNLNIHGNVNMRIDGNWFVEHIGNYYEYREGDTYIKQKGSTYIEQEGTVITKLTGNERKEHIGNSYLIHNGDTTITHSGLYFETINGNVTLVYNAECKLSVGKNYSEIIRGSKSSDIIEDSFITIGGNYTQLVAEDVHISNEGIYEFLVGDSISVISYSGNISLETKGEFELMNDGKITPKGFDNIGTKGNIQIISTFGNINLQCKKDDSKADFGTDSIVIPWNPGFVAELERASLKYPLFNKQQAISEAESIIPNIKSLNDFIDVFKSVTNLLIYDGLPVFLPSKMIVQNPNIPTPNNPDDLSWIPDFRSEASDWRNISQKHYWKLPGRLMGNINVETWSGDINIKTHSELGCAGNINLEAIEKTGTLPGYKIGCINFKNSGKKRIYPDPRDLFLDSNFISREAGQIQLFSHGTNLSDSFRRSVLPTAANSILNSLGFSFNWTATNYKDFYKLYGMNVITKGSFGSLSSQSTDRLNNLIENRPDPILGCTRCISDYLLGIPGVQYLCYASENFEKFASTGLHKYNVAKFDPFDDKNTRGTFNGPFTDFDKISYGDGHAIEMGFIDREFVGENIGHFSINSSGSFTKNIGRNYYFNCNTDYDEGKKSISYTYSEDWFDDALPQELNVIFDTANNLLNKLIKPIKNTISAKEFGGNLTKDVLDQVLPPIGSLKTRKRVVSETSSLGKIFKSGYSKEENVNVAISFDGNTIKLGETFSPLKNIIQNILTCNSINILVNHSDEIKRFVQSPNNKDEHIETSSSALKANVKNYLNITTELNSENSYYYNTILKENESKISGGQNVRLLCEYEGMLMKSISVLLDFNNIRYELLGQGKNRLTNYNSYHEIKEDLMGEEVISSYVDYYENENISVCKKPEDNANCYGKPRDVKLNSNIDAGRSISKNITYTSPINENVLVLNSDDYWLDKDNETAYSMNLIKVKINGSTYELDSKYDDWEIKHANGIVVDQNSNAKTKSNNYISVLNGRETRNGKNIIEINNGDSSAGSTNLYSVNNGNISDESLGKDNQELNKIELVCSPNGGIGGGESSSYTLYSNRYKDGGDTVLKSYIVEYADVEKILTTNFITVNSEDYISNTNQYVLNAASRIQLSSPRIKEDFSVIDPIMISSPKEKNKSSLFTSLINKIKEVISDVFNKI